MNVDLQAAETAHKTEKVQTKQSWNCPCAGCKKAVKQERLRILSELDSIDINAPYQLNAVGLKQLVIDIVTEGDKK
jgi:hypothetical protein